MFTTTKSVQKNGMINQPAKNITKKKTKNIAKPKNTQNQQPPKSKIQNPLILTSLGGYVPYIYCHDKCINKGTPVPNSRKNVWPPFPRRQNGTTVKMYGVLSGTPPWLYISWGVGIMALPVREKHFSTSPLEGNSAASIQALQPWNAVAHDRWVSVTAITFLGEPSFLGSHGQEIHK